MRRRDPSDPQRWLLHTPREFEAHVAALRGQWAVLPLSEIAERLADGVPLPRRAVHVSLDDGFASALDAAEILDRYRIPWTLFVITDTLDAFVPVFARLADTVSLATGVIAWRGAAYDLSRPGARPALLAALSAVVIGLGAEAMSAAVEPLLREAGLAERRGETRRFLSAAQVRQLHAAGVEIGSHSRRHPDLCRCIDAELAAELRESQATLEAITQAPVRYLAFPYGAYDARVAAAASRHYTLSLGTASALRRAAPGVLWRSVPGPRPHDLGVALSPWSRWRRRA